MNATHAAVGKIIAGLTKWGLSIVFGMAITYYGAYVLGYHWNWFLVPEGFEVPSMRARIGMALIFTLFLIGPLAALKITNEKTEKMSEDVSEATMAFVRSLLIALAITTSWGMGWVWNWWLG